MSKKDKKAKKEIAAMVINELKSKAKKEKIVTFEKEKDDDDLYDLVRGGELREYRMHVYYDII